MIEMKNISKRREQFFLDSISFQLPKGMICGLVGQNGAGKTTLIHILLGLCKTDSGELSFGGLTFEETEKELRDEIGVVLEEDFYEEDFSPLDLCEYYGLFYSRFTKECFLEYCDKFQVPIKRKLRKMSKGERMKVQFAFALTVKPKYLFLDEPVANFDPEFTSLFWKILSEFVSNEENSVMIASHLTKDLDRYADYLLYLDHGKQIFAGDMETFRDTYRIATGEKYLLKKIPQAQRIATLESKYQEATTLVYYNSKRNYDERIHFQIPTIESVMYYHSLAKGDGKNEYRKKME